MVTKSSSADKVPVSPIDLSQGGSKSVDYDLRSQDKIIRGRMPTLEIILERFVRMYRLTLSSAVRRVVDVDVDSIHLVKFGSFLRNLEVPSSLHLFTMRPLRGASILSYDPRFFSTMIDLFFGGSGDRDVDMGGRDFTAIEQQIFKRVGVSTLEDLQAAWNPVFPVQFNHLRMEVNPQFVAVAPHSEVVIVTTFNVDIGRDPLKFTLCIPYSVVEPLRALLNAGFTHREYKQNEVWVDRLERNIQSSPMQITARVEGVPITAKDFLALKPGDLLSSQHNPSKPIGLTIGGIRKFTGTVVEEGGRQAIRVEEVIPAKRDEAVDNLRTEALALEAQAATQEEEQSNQAAPVAEAGGGESRAKSPALPSLAGLGAREIAALIAVEHPQTIALILAHLDSAESTGGVLSQLPEGIQSDVLNRLSNFAGVQQGVVQEIDGVIARELGGMADDGMAEGSGAKIAGAAIATLDKTTASRMLSSLEEQDPEAAKKLSEEMKTGAAKVKK